MSRLTITLSDDLHRALKETATYQGRSIGSVVEESLRMCGIQDHTGTNSQVARASKPGHRDSDKAIE